jgi:hypothetical protein
MIISEVLEVPGEYAFRHDRFMVDGKRILILSVKTSLNATHVHKSKV